MFKKYQEAKPFKHYVYDEFFPCDLAWDIHKTFPKPTNRFYEYDNLLEKKKATDRLDLMPYPIYEAMFLLNSSSFVTFLEQLTGIHGLITDPHWRGGGMHIIEKGGFLDLHRDFGRNDRLNIYRRLNVLVYFNFGWKESDGGQLELWDEKLESHVSIEPKFNRMSVFETTGKTYHGHPNKWNGSTNRISLASYYYTVEKPEDANLNSTTFVARPGDPDSDEKKELRAIRAKGRIASNV